MQLCSTYISILHFIGILVAHRDVVCQTWSSSGLMQQYVREEATERKKLLQLYSVKLYCMVNSHATKLHSNAIK